MATLESSKFGSTCQSQRVFTLLYTWFAVAAFKSHHVNAYSRPSIFRRPLLHTALQKRTILSMAGSGFGKSSNKEPASTPSPSKSSSYELFELQELRAQLETITKQNILYQSLSSEKRQELTKYVKAVIKKTDSPIDVSGKRNSMGTVQFVAGIEGKSWRMVFTTESPNRENDSGSARVEDDVAELPYGSTVILRIGQFEGTQGTLDYVLKFSKQVMGLRELVAKSTCSVDIGPVNPGLLTFEYQDIKTKLFGLSNLPVGFFGLLKGRVTYVDTIWFDGERWIERNYSASGNLIYSVYVRDLQDEEKQ